MVQRVRDKAVQELRKTIVKALGIPRGHGDWATINKFTRAVVETMSLTEIAAYVAGDYEPPYFHVDYFRAAWAQWPENWERCHPSHTSPKNTRTRKRTGWETEHSTCT